jgi:mRNA interferase YafQ
MRLLTTNRFEKDLARSRRRGKDLDKLWRIVERLLSRQPLDRRNRLHRLSGDWSACWECHIEPDWLLI